MSVASPGTAEIIAQYYLPQHYLPQPLRLIGVDLSHQWFLPLKPDRFFLFFRNASGIKDSFGIMEP